LQANNKEYGEITGKMIANRLEMLYYIGEVNKEGLVLIMENEKNLLEIYKPGETLVFGTYEGTPIHWRVLDMKGKERLLLAEDILTRLPYNKNYVSIYWQKCSLRKWLNQQFYKEAFSFGEQTQILNTRLENLPNRDHSVGNGPDTVDKIFLLSLEELEHYIPLPADRIRTDWWWLRSIGSNDLSACSVYTDGSVYTYGINIHFNDGGVRPAMWIRLRNTNKGN